jgi:hypothetical protein
MLWALSDPHVAIFCVVLVVANTFLAVIGMTALRARTKLLEGRLDELEAIISEDAEAEEEPAP